MMQGGLTCDATVIKANGQPAEEPQPKQAMLHLRPCRWGVMHYFPHDFYIGGALERYGEYADAETQFLRALINPGDIVCEVGANIGCHTLPLAERVGNAGRVLAFEPQRILFNMLAGNLSLNGMWNVIVERVALGARNGVMQVPPVDYSAEGNFGGVALRAGDGEHGEPVPMMPLDAYDMPACALLKIDVEGMEEQVLRGASATIKKHRPTLYVENDRSDRAQALVEYLRDLDYGLRWHLPKLYSPTNFRNNPENVYGEVVSVNMLCVPSEKPWPAVGDGLPPVLLPHERVATSGVLQ